MKRVVLDARLTRQMSVGMKAYARELRTRLPRVASEYTFVALDQGSNFGWSEQVGLVRAIRRARADVTHFLSLYAPLLAPRPYAVTIHDLIHLRYPQYFKAKVGPYYRTAVRLLCARAARVLTDDQRTVGDLQRFLGVNPEKIRVVPLGVDEVFLHAGAAPAAPRPYLLYAGNHRPHKDLRTLFAAWAALPAELEIDLYLTGSDDFEPPLREFARANGRVVALGEVSAERLAAYYAGAAAFVYPSLCEGFGLPVLEAMAAGCPAIVCEDAVAAPLRPAALTFGARDVRGACANIERVLADQGLRGRLVNAGRNIARELTWDRCARATADVYREILEERPR